jgi:hypothetical protein
VIWLEEYHINKYVKKYDKRLEGRYIHPPEIRSEFSVGDKVVIRPQGRFAAFLGAGLRGKKGRITEILDVNPHRIAGRHCRVVLFSGAEFVIREINLRGVVDKPEII